MEKEPVNLEQEPMWDAEAMGVLLTLIKVMVISAIALVSLKCLATDVAVVVNGNFEELKNAAASASLELKSAGGTLSDVPIYQLDGSPADFKKMGDLITDDPRVVIALGVYAAKKTRQALPGTPIIYSSVRYPEYEDFVPDKKMVGVLSSGAEASLSKLVSSFVAGRADFPDAKRIAVMYSDDLEPSVAPLIERLRKAGLEHAPMPLSEAPLLELVMQEVSAKYQSLLLIPDKNTQNDYSLRFILTRCMEKRVLTFALDHSLVEKGVLCGVFAKPEECAIYAAGIARNFLATGKLPGQPVLTPPRSYTALNSGASRYMEIGNGAQFDAIIK